MSLMGLMACVFIAMSAVLFINSRKVVLAIGLLYFGTVLVTIARGVVVKLRLIPVHSPGQIAQELVFWISMLLLPGTSAWGVLGCFSRVPQRMLGRRVSLALLIASLVLAPAFYFSLISLVG